MLDLEEVQPSLFRSVGDMNGQGWRDAYRWLKKHKLSGHQVLIVMRLRADSERWAKSVREIKWGKWMSTYHKLRKSLRDYGAVEVMFSVQNSGRWRPGQVIRPRERGYPLWPGMRAYERWWSRQFVEHVQVFPDISVIVDATFGEGSANTADFSRRRAVCWSCGHQVFDQGEFTGVESFNSMDGWTCVMCKKAIGFNDGYLVYEPWGEKAGPTLSLSLVVDAYEDTFRYRTEKVFLDRQGQAWNELAKQAAEMAVIQRGACTLAGVLDDDAALDEMRRVNEERRQAELEEMRASGRLR